MGRKKKKGLSNRLAKMSDEERARYLQHRAAVEEEAKRRKEQLITTFMKNKIKKEEAFTRLNVAKINEYWHQVLRKIILKNMRGEIKDLSEWIQKVIEIKNCLINKLMIELDESEVQYQNNFESQLSFIDQFFNKHHQRQEDIKSDFDRKHNDLLNDAIENNISMKEKSEEEYKYLKTVIFTLEKNFEESNQADSNQKEAILDDYTTSFRAQQEAMVYSYIKTMDSTWKNIHDVLNEYLSRTSLRRHHYIELKHLDDRNKAEREDNEKIINKYNIILKSMKRKFSIMQENKEQELKILTEEQKTLENTHKCLKKNLKTSLIFDNNKLSTMTKISNNSITELSGILKKGQNVLQMIKFCRRLETDEEKRQNWTEMRAKWYNFHETYYGSFEKTLEDKFDATEKSKIKQVLESKEISEEEIFKSDEKSEEEILQSEVKSEEQILGVEVKSEEQIVESDKISKEEESCKIMEDYQYLNNLDVLWWVCNRAEIDTIELKKEKAKLRAENEKLKGIVKGILEDANLEPIAPKVPSLKIRPNILSAPPNLGSSKLTRQLPNCVVIEFQ